MTPSKHGDKEKGRAATSRFEVILILVILVEIAAGGFLLLRSESHITAPLPALSETDPATGRELTALAGQCSTAEDWRLLADKYMATGFLPEAEACLRQAHHMQPEDPQTLFARAFCLSRVGRIRESLDGFQRALELGFERPEDCWFFIGRNYLRQDDPDKALQAFSQAAEFSPIQLEIARLHFRRGEAEQAEQYLTKVLRTHPHAIQPNALGFQIARDKGNRSKAGYFSDQMEFASDPLEHPFAHQWQRLDRVRNGLPPERLYSKAQAAGERQPDTTAATLQQAMENRWEPRLGDLMAFIEIRRGRPEEAVGWMQKVVQEAGPSTSNLWHLGEALQQAGKTEAAQKAWLRADAMASLEDRVGLLHKLAKSYEGPALTSDYMRYQAAFKHNYGVGLYWKRKWNEAIGHLRFAAEHGSSPAHSWYYLGEAFRALGDPEKARKAYLECLERDPEHGRAHARLDRLGNTE